MKHIFFGMTMLAMTCVILISIMSISGRTQRDSEAKDALDAAMKETVETLSSKGTYYPKDSEDLMADFVQLFATNINATSTVTNVMKMDGTKKTVQLIDQNDPDSNDPDKSKTVFQFDFYKADYEDGLLSAKVKEKITYPGGKQSFIESSGVVIMEEEDPKESYTTTFLLPDDIMLKNFGYQSQQRYAGPGLIEGNEVAAAAETPFPYDDYAIYRNYVTVEDTPLTVPVTIPTTKGVADAAEVTSWKVVYAGEGSKDVGKDGTTEFKIGNHYTNEELSAKTSVCDLVLIPYTGT